jgi:chemotaxis signal transduction protein
VIDLCLLFESVRSRECLSTRIIIVSGAGDDHTSRLNASERSVQDRADLSSARPEEAGLLGLIGEEVSDLLFVQPEQIEPVPIPLPQKTLLDGIVQTENGIIQLLAVQRIRETTLVDDLLDQGPAQHARA